jgi:hypothetical protein
MPLQGQDYLEVLCMNAPFGVHSGVYKRQPRGTMVEHENAYITSCLVWSREALEE